MPDKVPRFNDGPGQGYNTTKVQKAKDPLNHPDQPELQRDASGNSRKNEFTKQRPSQGDYSSVRNTGSSK